MSQEENINCSFCGRSKIDTGILIAGLTGHICSSCIEQAHGIIEEQKKHDQAQDYNHDFKLLTPLQIKEELDEYVIGQDDAKRVLAVSVYNH